MRQLAAITGYLAEDFQEEALLRFQSKWAEFTATVEAHPQRFPYYETLLGKRLHKGVLLHLTVVLFSYDKERVIVEAIFDARSDWQQKL